MAFFILLLSTIKPFLRVGIREAADVSVSGPWFMLLPQLQYLSLSLKTRLLSANLPKTTQLLRGRAWVSSALVCACLLVKPGPSALVL